MDAKLTVVIEDTAGYVAMCQQAGERSEYLSGVLVTIGYLYGHDTALQVRAAIDALVPVVLAKLNREAVERIEAQIANAKAKLAEQSPDEDMGRWRHSLAVLEKQLLNYTGK